MFFSSISEVKIVEKQNSESEMKSIYLDFQATTPLDYRVLDTMLPFLTSQYGNPHSRTHQYGWETENSVENARKQIGNLIGADSKEIIFTSGATESNNAALKEHKCILDTCRHLEDQGLKITYLPVSFNGLVDPQQILDNITNDTLCVSVMFVNNEIGVIQNLKSIGKICRDKKVFLHTDAAQAIGKIPVNVNELNIDLMSMSSHKIYGPKGIGALYVRRKPKVRILPIINGGGQERGLRSGTLAPALCVGFGAACEIAQKELENDTQHIKKLSTQLISKLNTNLTHISYNGDLEQRYMGNINVSFAYVEGESLLMAIKQIAVSSGSACTSASLEPSYVLRALGVQEDLAHTSIRIGIGRFTTEEEIEYVADTLIKAVNRLRDLSPLWEMAQEGIDINSIQWSQPH